MNLSSRIKIAEMLARIARNVGGAETGISHERGSTYVRCRFPAVRVSFDIDDKLQGGILASWHGADRDLSPLAFDSVNECHKRKATLYGADLNSFAHKFDRACRMVKDGRAYA